MKSFTNCILTGAIVLAACYLQACNKKDKVAAPETGPATITADFQSGFEQNRVQYQVDGWQVFDQKLNTRPGVGLAYSQENPLQEGPHRVRIVVDGVHTKDTVLNLQRNLFLGVNYNKGEIRILFSETRWTNN